MNARRPHQGAAVFWQLRQSMIRCWWIQTRQKGLIGSFRHFVASALSRVYRIGRISADTTNRICATRECHDGKYSGNWSNM